MNTGQIAGSPHAGGKFICPWQIVPFIDNFLRPLVHHPRHLFSPYVRTGMTVLDVGCGAGFASLGLARLVGEEGMVIAADVQKKMLDFVSRRAVRLGLDGRIRTHLCEPGRIGLEEEVDFALAFFMLHEVPDDRAFLGEIYDMLKPRGLFFLTEPRIHVVRRSFEQAVEKAKSIGFTEIRRPAIRLGRAVLLEKGVSSPNPPGTSDR